MKIYFLGTGTSQGIPIIGSTDPVCLSQNPKDKRLRSSVWVQWDDADFVIDCGPDFRQQMLTSGCPKIDALLFTHEHADHTAGLDDIRPFVFRQGALPVYGLSRVMENLKRRFDYIFTDENKYPGAPSVKSNVIDAESPFMCVSKPIIPIKVTHYGLEVLGYRFDRFAYITDMFSIHPDEEAKLSGLDVLVVNALRIEPHPSHLHLDAAIEFAQRIGATRTYFTHISHKLGFHDKVETSLPEGIHLAYDNLTITL
ncbi:MAG: MBL fold metallo-hydrolase [Bacteroidetes bacterium]|nr:MBL fold metallo-hydrolase [Bacteroidota bacterium]MDA0888098.1 MBL fold metallo-hydrolase [Bacteroidota bacterium]MDA1084050.1 MBL fold metallo-hydrolase [Bacteroidota bacterium]